MKAEKSKNKKEQQFQKRTLLKSNSVRVRYLAWSGARAMGIGRWARGCEEFGKQCAPAAPHARAACGCGRNLFLSSELDRLGCAMCVFVWVHVAGMSPVSGARHRCVDCPLSHVVACTFLRFAPKCLVHDTTPKAFVHWRRLGVLTLTDSLWLLRVRGSLQSGGVVETTTATSATVRA
jgi:hypothetical protein